MPLTPRRQTIVKEVKNSPNIKISRKLHLEGRSGPQRARRSSLKFLPPTSSQVTYVEKHVREKELRLLQSLQEDVQNISNRLKEKDVSTLPKGGMLLIDQLTALQAEVERRRERVANMVVVSEVPAPINIAKDGVAKQGPSWADIKKASIAVQPSKSSQQAMTDHTAERNLILERLRDLHESLASSPPESAAAPAPPLLTITLMPHQLHALAWLLWRETQRPCGGILADDMGLGKTLTMISLILSDLEGNINDDDDDEDKYFRKRSKLSRGGTLVVCPASLMQQWADEIKKHCAAHKLSVCLHHGPARTNMPYRLAPNHIVLTTYNILQRDKVTKGVLMRVRWRRVILDEAHAIRNPKSATSLAVSALHARRRWCLTGTPVQNKDQDLFALIKFLRVTPFDDLTMWKKWIENKSHGGQERLSCIMRCILLRRTKQQLQESGQLTCLPERTMHQERITLTRQEGNVYQKVLVLSRTLFAQFLRQRAEKNADAQGSMSADKNFAYSKMYKKMVALQGAKPVKSHEILVLLLRLRQVCCHCGLIATMLDADAVDAGAVQEDAGGADLLAELNKLSLEESQRKSVEEEDEDDEEEEEDEEEDEGSEEEGTSLAEAIRSVLSPNNPVFDLQRLSSKTKAVMECLHGNVFTNESDKAIVVSQWTSVLRLVEQELDRAGIKCVTLSGNVPVRARAPLIDALNDPESPVKVMLLSLCAGGVGLNLCGANHLLLLDPHWNPQLEQQAQDRIYRVGQTKHVHIYRFIVVDTVEQAIRKLQEDKLELAENVLTGSRNKNSRLSIDDLKLLFKMRQ